MRSATVNERDGVLFICPSSLTVDGIWIDTGPLFKIEPGSSKHAIGEAILTALDASRVSVPQPSDWSSVTQPLLQAAGVKSWSTFMKRAKAVILRQDEIGLSLIPHKNLGPKEGFQAILENIATLRFPSSAQSIGNAVIDSLSRCK